MRLNSKFIVSHYKGILELNSKSDNYLIYLQVWGSKLHRHVLFYAFKLFFLDSINLLIKQYIDFNFFYVIQSKLKKKILYLLLYNANHAILTAENPIKKFCGNLDFHFFSLNHNYRIHSCIFFPVITKKP